LTVDIGTERRPTNLLHRSKTEPRTKTMFSPAMKLFDRVALSVFLMLAVTPMLTIAAAASIH
jgi:hypothetical protein